MLINTNLNSMGAQRHAGRLQSELSTAIARLSSGLRINTARDDAAGLAIANRFNAQIRGTDQAARNANDAISLAQTAESALGSVSEGLQRIRELAVQSANATNSSSDRAALQQEVAQLVQEIDRVATQTQFNGIHLIDGSFTARAFQVGANATESIPVAQIGSARTAALGQYQGFQLVNLSSSASTSPPSALTVTIGGTTIPLGSVERDAKAIAAAINNGNIPGMTASANPTYVAGASTFFSLASAAGNAVFTINGVGIALPGVPGAPGSAAQASNRASAVAAINAQSAATGVIATEAAGVVSLSAADGRNIQSSYSAGSFTGSIPADFGLAASPITGGTVNLTYVAPPGATGNVSFLQAGFVAFSATGTIAATGTRLSDIDVSTVLGANAALASIDVALANVNSWRASLGAVQNRFGSTIAHLAVTSENLQAARSRLHDADFAFETANLSRAQLLQQAGTAMLAQANQLPQQVMQLLR